MNTTASLSPNHSYHRAGWAAIASGVTGIIATFCLIASLVLRESSPSAGDALDRFHNAGLIVQFILMMPFITGLYNLSKQQLSGMNRKELVTGIAAICFVVLFILLAFPKVVAVVLYMFPQGIFGAWLIFINWRMKGILSKGLRWFGIVVGAGLAITGIFIPGYAIFVDPIILQIPAAPDELVAKIPINTANTILHQFLFIGLFTGVLTLPFWTILTGYQLLRKRLRFAQLG